jgi:hypothetical protein
MENTQKIVREIVEGYYKIDITDKTRRRPYVEARALYYKLLRDNTRLSMEQIGKGMNKDHSTVVYFIKQIDNWIEYDRGLRIDYEILNERLTKAMDLNPKGFKLSESFEGFWEKEYKTLKAEYDELQIQYNTCANIISDYHQVKEENKQLRMQNGYLTSKQIKV